MNEFKPVYYYSREDAIRRGEINEWRESLSENIACAKSIDVAIHNHYSHHRLDIDCVNEVLDEYGFERVNMVLANTMRYNLGDPRFSNSNYAWADSICIPQGDAAVMYRVSAHPGLVNIFANAVHAEESHTIISNEPNLEGM